MGGRFWRKGRGREGKERLKQLMHTVVVRYLLIVVGCLWTAQARRTLYD